MPAHLDGSRPLKLPQVLTLYEYTQLLVQFLLLFLVPILRRGEANIHYHYCPHQLTTIIVIIIVFTSVIITIATGTLGIINGTLGIIYPYSPVYTTIIVPIIICNITAGCGLVGSASMLLLLTPPKLLPAAVPVVLEYSRFVVR